MSENNGDKDGGIPVIDMSQKDELIVASQLLQAFTTIGFATLIHHDIEPTIIARVFDHSRSFFALPEETKLQYKFQSYEANRGYIGLGMETHDKTTTPVPPDKKETFDIGKEQDGDYENLWPTETGESFRTDMLSYFGAFDALNLDIMRLLAIALKLTDQDYFVKRCNGQHENMRLLHYPAISLSDKDKKKNEDADDVVFRGNVHTDFGTITLLVQDDVGGLRAQRLDGSWVSVPPVSGSIVVNVGDMLQRWSNDVLVATPHQVINTQQERGDDDDMMIPERYSVAFFCNANKDTLLECLEQCTSEDRPILYPPINAHEYLTMRLSQTIAKEATTSTSQAQDEQPSK